MLYGKVKRYMSEKITSVEDEILSYQEGFIRDGNTALELTAIPCGIETVIGLQVTPVDDCCGETVDNATSLASFGLKQLETLTRDEVVAIDAGIIPDYSAAAANKVGNLVKTADWVYVCTEDKGAGEDALDTKFVPVRSDSFLLLRHPAGAAQFTYLITGYKDN